MIGHRHMKKVVTFFKSVKEALLIPCVAIRLATKLCDKKVSDTKMVVDFEQFFFC